MNTPTLLQLGPKILNDLPLLWTFLLLATRFAGMMLIMPGVGGGMSGMVVRYPAILVLAFAAMPSSGISAALPSDWAILLLQVGSEFMLGFALAMIPLMMVSGVQMGGYLSSTSMGLGAGNLMDPTLGMPSTDLARIFGDLSVVIFLLLGGHYMVIHAVSGLSGEIVPGSFVASDLSLDLLLRSGEDIFRIGVMISAPVIVALLLTQFVMGLITRAVPTVNVFVVSFPLTIGIGLILSLLSIPELYRFLQHEFVSVDRRVGGFAESAKP